MSSKKLTTGAPPMRGPTPQGIGFNIGVMVMIKKPGCPYRENGVGMSDIKGIKDIQVKGKKFTGVK